MTPEEILKSLEPYLETYRLNREELQGAVQLINGILSDPQYKTSERIGIDDVEFTYYFLTNRHYTEKDNDGTFIVNSYKKLSQIIFDSYYPKPTGTKFYHYTKVSALKNILKGQLKLNPLIKNESYHEFKTFYIDHNLIGYTINTDDKGKLMEQVIMEECYTMCFASPVGLTISNEESLWNSFGDNDRGVRIEFNIETKHADFRHIFYKNNNFNNKDLLINKINSECQSKYNRIFTVAGLSKIGVFYLPGLYNIENEVRFLIKKYTDDYEFNFDNSEGFINLPFDSEYASFSIKKIKLGKYCDLTEIENILKENNYSCEIIETN